MPVNQLPGEACEAIELGLDAGLPQITVHYFGIAAAATVDDADVAEIERGNTAGQ